MYQIFQSELLQKNREWCAGYVDRLQMYRVYTEHICSVYLCFI